MISNLINILILKRRGIWSNSFAREKIIYDLFGDYFIDADIGALNKSQYWDADLIKEIQLHRLKHIVNRAYKKSAFWREHFKSCGFDPAGFKNLSDFNAIKPVTKELLKNNQFCGISGDIKLSDCFAEETSGSSGTPFGFYIDRGHILRSFGFCQRMFNWAGFQEGDLVVRFWIRDRQGFSRDYVSMLSLYFEEAERGLEELMKLGEKRKLLLFSFGSAFLRLARMTKDRNVRLNLRSAIYSGEALSAGEKRFVEENLGCRVFNCYACRDAGWLAQECESGNLHINPEWAYLEIIGGRIVVTAFDNEVMPFIRYETGDFGRILSDRCRCGRALPILELRGRETETLNLPGGQKINFLEFAHLFDKWFSKIDAFQVIQESLDIIRVNLVVKNFYKSNEDENLLSKEIKRYLGDKIRIIFNYLDNTDEMSVIGGKRKTFISKMSL